MSLQLNENNHQQQQCYHRLIKNNFCQYCAIYKPQGMNIIGLKNSLLNRQRMQSHQIINKLKNNLINLSKGKQYQLLNSSIIESFQKINKILTSFQFHHISYHTKILAMYIFWHSLEMNYKFKQKDIYLSILIAIKILQPNILRLNFAYFKQMINLNIYHKNSLKNSSKIQYRSQDTSQSQCQINSNSNNLNSNSTILSISQCQSNFSYNNQQNLLIFEQIQKLKRIQFKTTIVSFVDFIQFYVVSGIMFNSQLRKVKYTKIITFIEQEIQKYLKNGLFFNQKNQEHLALKILYQARQKCDQIDQIWNWHLEIITQTKKEQIQKIIREGIQENVDKNQRLSLRSNDMNRQNFIPSKHIHQTNFKYRSKLKISCKSNKINQNSFLKQSLNHQSKTRIPIR